MSTAAVGSAENRQESFDPEFDFEYKTVGDDVKDAVGSLWYLLTVDQARINELLEKSSASAEDTRQKQEVIRELRSTYEVEIERDEQNPRELTYHLTDSAVSPLGENDIGAETLGASKGGREAVVSAAESASDGLRREESRVIEPMHSDTIHEKMTDAALEGSEHDAQWKINIMGAASKEPDYWEQKCQVCSSNWISWGDGYDHTSLPLGEAEEYLRKLIREVDESASPHHMYVPGGERFQYQPVEVELSGAAPQDAQEHWERGLEGYSTDWNQSGYAFHFLQDMSQPLHTGSIGPQALQSQGPVHHGFKSFVEDNWENGSDVQTDFKENFRSGANFPRWPGSMEDACKVMANESSKYSDNVYETIYNNGANSRDDWDPIVDAAASASINVLGRLSRGGINQV